MQVTTIKLVQTEGEDMPAGRYLKCPESYTCFHREIILSENRTENNENNYHIKITVKLYTKRKSTKNV